MACIQCHVRPCEPTPVSFSMAVGSGGGYPGSRWVPRGFPDVDFYRRYLPGEFRTLVHIVRLAWPGPADFHPSDVRIDLVQSRADCSILQWSDAMADQIHGTGGWRTLRTAHLSRQPTHAILDDGHRLWRSRGHGADRRKHSVCDRSVARDLFDGGCLSLRRCDSEFSDSCFCWRLPVGNWFAGTSRTICLAGWIVAAGRFLCLCCIDCVRCPAVVGAASPETAAFCEPSFPAACLRLPRYLDGIDRKDQVSRRYPRSRHRHVQTRFSK